MRKTLAAAGMAASLTLGGAAGVALFTPQLVNAAQEVTDEATDGDRDDRRAERLGEILAPLVDDGTIDQGQADAVIDAIVEAAPDRHGHRFRLHVMGIVTDVLDLTPEELRDELSDGATTIRELAEDAGVEPQSIVDAIVAAAQEHLDAAVADGKLTEEEAAEKLAEAEERAQELLDRTFDGDGPGNGQGHGPGGRFGPGGPRN